MMRCFMAALLVASAVAPAQVPRLAPAGWGLAGSNPEGYTAGLDRAEAFSGKASAVLAATDTSPSGFGALSQCVKADSYAGKRIRYAAEVRTLGAADWAGLWLRVDGKDGEILAFDNMQDAGRRLHGDMPWGEYRIVADVPAGAYDICFGVLLNGAGKLWIDALRMEAVESGEPTTAKPMAYSNGKSLPSFVLLSSPRNLDFEE